MYEELIKRLRERAQRENDYFEHGGDIIKEAADVIEKLSFEVLSDRAILKRYGGETGIKNLQEYANKYWDTLAKIPRWIPVTERLPEEGVPVLACFDSGGRIAKTVCEWFTDNRNQMSWVYWFGGLCGVEPTHWMPLPLTPKEET